MKRRSFLIVLMLATHSQPLAPAAQSRWKGGSANPGMFAFRIRPICRRLGFPTVTVVVVYVVNDDHSSRVSLISIAISSIMSGLVYV